MMPIDFPNSPAVNDVYSAAGKSWVYDGTSWNLRSIAAGPGSITSTELANSSVTSAKIEDGTIVNADVASNAAVAYSKLSLSNTIVNADIATNAAINTTKITNWEDDQVILTTAVFL